MVSFILSYNFKASMFIEHSILLMFTSLSKCKANATTFNAETHCKSFTTTFNELGFEHVCDFAMGQIADSTAMNPKIARLLKIVHIACRNHCLNLACKDMEADDTELGQLTTDTQDVHRTINASNKLCAVLYNVSMSTC